jgi:hypothetical protein
MEQWRNDTEREVEVFGDRPVLVLAVWKGLTRKIMRLNWWNCCHLFSRFLETLYKKQRLVGNGHGK